MDLLVPGLTDRSAAAADYVDFGSTDIMPNSIGPSETIEVPSQSVVAPASHAGHLHKVR